MIKQYLNPARFLNDWVRCLQVKQLTAERGSIQPKHSSWQFPTECKSPKLFTPIGTSF